MQPSRNKDNKLYKNSLRNVFHTLTWLIIHTCMRYHLTFIRPQTKVFALKMKHTDKHTHTCLKNSKLNVKTWLVIFEYCSFGVYGGENQDRFPWNICHQSIMLVVIPFSVFSYYICVFRSIKENSIVWHSDDVHRSIESHTLRLNCAIILLVALCRGFTLCLCLCSWYAETLQHFPMGI